VAAFDVESQIVPLSTLLEPATDGPRRLAVAVDVGQIEQPPALLVVQVKQPRSDRIVAEVGGAEDESLVVSQRGAP
jgi:hypothetical protein